MNNDIIKQGKAISTGVKNFLVKKDDIEEIAKKRLEICNTCIYNNQSSPNRCKVCGCILKFKVRQSIQTCPKNYW